MRSQASSNRYSPVGANDIAARFAQIMKDVGGARAEVNRRHTSAANRVKDFARVGKDELSVVGRAQGAGPRVENLNGLRPCLNLRLHVFGDDRAQHVREPVPRTRVRIHQRFGERKVLRMAAFDGVGRESEGRTAESNQRDAMRTVELAPDQANRFQHVRQRLARLKAFQTIDVGFGAQRIFDGRSFATDEVERNAHGFEREQQIGKENRRVHIDAPHRLQRDDGRQLGRAADLEQRVPAANLAILRHVAASLSHEPHRSAIDRLTPAGFQKSVVHVGGIVLQGPAKAGHYVQWLKPDTDVQWLKPDATYSGQPDRDQTFNRFRASASRSSSQSGLKRTSAPSPRNSRETASSRK